MRLLRLAALASAGVLAAFTVRRAVLLLAACRTPIIPRPLLPQVSHARRGTTEHEIHDDPGHVPSP